MLLTLNANVDDVLVDRTLVAVISLPKYVQEINGFTELVQV